MATIRQNLYQQAKEKTDEYAEYGGVFVYIVRCNEFHKIGLASNLYSRLNSIQGGNPYDVELVWAAKVMDSKVTEKALHELFKEKRGRGEWFRLERPDIALVEDTTMKAIKRLSVV